MAFDPRTRLVTVSASYGAGGAVVAPALADRLGVPFLQRATTSAARSAHSRRVVSSSCSTVDISFHLPLLLILLLATRTPRA